MENLWSIAAANKNSSILAKDSPKHCRRPEFPRRYYILNHISNSEDNTIKIIIFSLINAFLIYIPYPVKTAWSHLSLNPIFHLFLGNVPDKIPQAFPTDQGLSDTVPSMQRLMCPKFFENTVQVLRKACRKFKQLIHIKVIINSNIKLYLLKIHKIKCCIKLFLILPNYTDHSTKNSYPIRCIEPETIEVRVAKYFFKPI